MIRTFFLFPALFLAFVISATAQTTVPQDTLPTRPGRSGLQISGETIICPGSLTALKVEGQYTRYQWSTGHLTPNLTVYTPGMYSVTVTTSGGCELTGTVTVRYASGPCL